MVDSGAGAASDSRRRFEPEGNVYNSNKVVERQRKSATADGMTRLVGHSDREGQDLLR